MSRSTTTPQKTHTVKTKHNKPSNAEVMERIRTMPAAKANKAMQRMVEDAIGTMMALQGVIAARSKAGA